MILTNFFINSIQTEIIAGKDAAHALILFSICSREYANAETVTTTLEVIVQNYESTKNFILHTKRSSDLIVEKSQHVFVFILNALTIQTPTLAGTNVVAKYSHFLATRNC